MLGVLGVTPSLGVANVYKPIPRSGATPSLEGARLGMPEVLGVIPSLGVANVYKPIPRSGATPSLEGARLGMPVTVRKGLGMGDVN